MTPPRWTPRALDFALALLLALAPTSAGCFGPDEPGRGGTAAAAERQPSEASAPSADAVSLGSAADLLVVDEDFELPPPAVRPGSAAANGVGGGAASSAPGEAVAAAHDPGLGREGGRALDSSQIKSVVDTRSPQVKACYERELKKNPALGGKMVVSWTIGADGRVRSPRVVRNSTGSRAMVPCVTKAVADWRFPKAESPSDVEYPFAFRSQDAF
jgi:outer membrane biosynthesis protein TonB